MNRFFKPGLLYAVVLILIWACTKEINLITDVELEFTETNTSSGFVKDLLPATITVTPEAFLEEYEYYFQYRVIQGEGVFLNEAEEELPQEENILLIREEDEESITLNLNYRPDVPGTHTVEVIASDNVDREIKIIQTYTVKNLDILWNASTTIVETPPAVVVPISLNLQNNSQDQDLTFEWRYTYTSGAGTLTTIEDQSLLLNKFTSIVPGNYVFKAISNQAGPTTIAFELVDSNGQALTREVQFETTLDALSPDTTISSFVVNGINAQIDGSEIVLSLLEGIDVSRLTPTITIPQDATVTPKSGAVQDFTNSVTYEVTAADRATKATYIVTAIIQDIPVMAITLDRENISLPVDSKETVVATVSPANATNQTINWTPEDPTIATVSADGVVTAVAVGQTTIKAYATENPGVFGSATVTVTDVNIPVTLIEIGAANTEPVLATNVQLNAKFTPSDSTDKEIDWSSSDPSIATVNTSGLVTTVATGTVEIIARLKSNPEIRNSILLTIKPNIINADAIRITPATGSTVVGGKISLSATVSPGNSTNKEITWSSNDTAIATVDNIGTVMGITNGTVIITATLNADSDIKATAMVTIKENVIPVSGIAVNPTTATIEKGSNSIITANIQPENASDKGVTWTSDQSAVATVDANGVVTGIDNGTVTITATSSSDTSKKATATITITTSDVSVTDISVDPANITILEDENAIIIAQIKPANATNKGVTWSSSNTAVATVDANGKIQAIAQGVATITAISNEDSNKKATVNVTVNSRIIPVTKLSIEPGATTVETGNTAKLTATVEPANATNRGITWSSSNTSVATVNGTGEVKAITSGSTTITATSSADNTKIAIANVTVIVGNIPVTGIIIEPQTITIEAGNTAKLIATVQPANATDKEINWSSSNVAVATVNTNGQVNAIASGTAVITATSSTDTTKNATTSVSVPINNIPVTSLTITPTTATIDEGEKLSINAVIKPDNATNKGINWSSSDTTIATVDANGTITGIAEGTATIIAVSTEDSGKLTTASITVKKPIIPVSSIAVSPSSATIEEGETINLIATVTPDNATNKNVNWSSNNTSIATVDANGKVSGIIEGSATITVVSQDNTSESSSVTISVKKKTIAVTRIDLSQNSITISLKKGASVTATVVPANATNKTIVWSSEDSNIADVVNGSITGKSVGNTRIIATAREGNSIMAFIDVSVVKNRNPVAVDDELSTDDEGNASLNVLQNDTDLDDDVLEIIDVSVPDHGNVTISPDRLTIIYEYTDRIREISDEFTYTISDKNGGTSIGNVSLEITPCPPEDCSKLNDEETQEYYVWCEFSCTCEFDEGGDECIPENL